jgi:hypothetical protein
MVVVTVVDHLGNIDESDRTLNDAATRKVMRESERGLEDNDETSVALW